ncbi:prostate and testis expressed protein 14-like [Rhineura floridana]|uniref:prostate and testis expressed protein 14-like n=1 Tax=Rhineura floridana TaxID=261503 RepID=UPI002AC87195|nr:prostate and testis expressed protein 14-like [Rhineura floridana]
MNKVLAVGFLALVYFDMDGTVQCRFCRNVKPDNTCSHPETTCRAGVWKLCYSRLISKGLSVVRVNRGCTKKCETITYKKNDYAKYMLCCDQDLCNNHKIWVKQ